MDKIIMHVDMNSYFATAEQQADPYLRGKPVGIVKAEGRGCVIAASVEAKKFGVKTGTTVWEARKLCPQIVLVPSDMDKYFSLTQRMIGILRDYSPALEVFSIDECFLDVSETKKLFAGGVLEVALDIKQRIKQDLGEWMRCSIGISFTKLLAKLASEMHKPDGLTWLTPADYIERTNDVAVEEVCGIGYARTKYLHGRGAYTLGQARRLADLPSEVVDLVWLRVEEQLTTISDLQPAKSVSRTFTAFRDLRFEIEIEKLVRNLIEEASSKLREMKMVGRTFSLSLTSSQYLTPSPSPNLGEGRYSFWARRTVKTPTDDPLVIFNLLWPPFARQWPSFGGVKFAGVGVSNLIFNFQFSIFNQRQDLLKAVDKVNEKHGLFTLYPATLLGGKLIRPEVTGYLGDKWYRFGAARGS